MKTHKILICGLAILASTSAQAQRQPETPYSTVAPQVTSHAPTFEAIAKNYLSCLASDNFGVVESALGHVTFMRIAYPKLDMTEIQERVFDLSINGSTQSIRSKAGLALQVFSDPSSFRDAIASKNGSGDGLLEAIAGRMVP